MAKNLQDTDLLLVNRGTESYKATFADFKDSLTTPLVIGDIFIKDAAGNVVNPASNPPTLSTTTQLTAEPQVSGGDAPYVNTFQWQRSGSDITDATSSIYTVATADIGKVLTCVVNAGDSADPQNTATKTSNPTGTVEADSPNTPTLNSPTNGSSVDGNNFTMLASALTPSTQTLKSTTFQVSAASDFSSTVVNETVDNSTSLTVKGKIDSGEMAYSTTYYARCLQTNTDSQSSEYSAVNTFTTNEEPPEPTDVDMSGLRFDVARQTSLTRSLDLFPQNITVSCWMKQTSDSEYKAILNSNGLGVLQDSGGFNVNNFGNSDYVSWSGVSQSLNEWINVVTQFTESKTTVWVNGQVVVDSTTASRGSTVPTDLGVGWYFSTNAALPGYLSEYYFVQNQALGPDVFGKTSGNGTWVPKTDTEIKAVINAGPESPYSDRANTSQTWSSNTTATGITSGAIANIYDGNPNTQVTVQGLGGDPSNPAQMILTLSPNLIVARNISFTYSTSQITYYSINDGATVAVPASASKTTFTIPFTGTLNQFRWKVKTNNELININEVFIDGRPLVDTGVWNNSQNWSENNSGFPAIAPASKAFDGNTDPGARAYAEGKGNTATITLPSAITVSSSLRVFIGAGNTSSGLLYINGNLITNITYPTGDGDWVTISGISSLSSIGVGRDSVGTYGNYTSLLAVEVDGTILVDAGEQYNTSRTWSDGVVFPNGQYVGGPCASSVGAGFDGTVDDGICAYITGDPIICNFDPAISGKLEWWSRDDSTKFGRTIILTQGGVEGSAITITEDSAWIDLGTVTSLSKIEITGEDPAGGTIDGMKLDGAWLVDPGFGPSGFYLPFDPTATGVDYGSYATPASNINTADGRNADTAFNGILATGSSGETNSSAPDNETSPYTLEWVFPTPIPFETLEYAFNANGRGTLYLNDVAQSTDANTNFNFKNAAGAVGTTLSSIKLVGDGQGPSTCYLQAIKVDGAMLVSHESVGVDDSGNNNDFFTANFIVAENINNSAKWSTGLSDAPVVTPGRVPDNMFNGMVGNGNAFMYQSSADGNPVIWTAQYTGATQIEIYLAIAAARVSVNSDSTFETYSPGWQTIYAGAAINNPVIRFKGNTNSISAYVSGFRINGQLMVDNDVPLGFLLDTVLDTPVSDYAVAVAGAGNGNVSISNGALNAQFTNSGASDCALSTLSTAIGTNSYYAEFAIGAGYGGNSQMIGITNDSSSASLGYTDSYAYESSGAKVTQGAGDSYGAQWAYGDVIGLLYNTAGTPGVGPISPYDTRANTSQTWSSGATSDTSFVQGRGMETSFNGDLSDFCASTSQGPGAFVQANFSPATVQKLEVRLPDAGVAVFTVSGTNITTTDISAPSKLTWFEIPITGDVSNIKVEVKSGDTARAHICAVRFDGRLLVDQSLWNNSRNWTAEGIISGDTLYVGGTSPYTNAFDGSLSTYWTPSTADKQPGGTQTFTFDNPISCTQVDIYYYRENDTVDIQVNGADAGVTVGSTPGWNTVINKAGSTLTSVAAEYVPGASAGIYAIRVDGKTLVDAGYQYNISQTWSDDLTVNGSTSGLTIENPTYAFDANFANAAVLKPSANGDQLIFGETLTGVTKLEIYQRSVCNISGTGISSITGAAANQWVTLYEGSSTTVSNITLTKTGDDPGIYAIKVNGKLLVNPSSPTGSLSFFKNGVDQGVAYSNLSADQYYIGTSGFSPQTAAINYGQQPFFYAINNNDGTAIVNADANQSYTWSNGLTASQWTSTDMTLPFNGDLTNGITATSGSAATWTPPSPVTFNESKGGVQMYLPATSGTNFTYQVNGQAVFTHNGADSGFVTITTGNGTLSSITFGADTGFRAVKVNGRLLVDVGSWNQSQMWSAGRVVGTTNAGGPWRYAFNGDLTNSCFASGGSSTLTLSTPLTYTSSVEVYGLLFPSGQYGASSISVNGTVVTGLNESVSDADAKWVTVLSGNGTLNTLTSQNYGLIFAVRVDGDILVDGQITTQLLVDKISEQDGVGTLFYDENQGGITTLLRLMNRYGFKGAKPGCGIYELTEQPNFDVANYIKSGDYYVPTRSYSRLFKCLLKAVAVDWAATTAFTKDQIVEYNDLFYCVTADHTTGSSFITDNLHIIQTAEAFTTAFAPAGQTSSSSGGGGGSY